MKICKYCGKEHANIGMTIIPSCVDVLIKNLNEEIEALKKPKGETLTLEHGAKGTRTEGMVRKVGEWRYEE